MREDSELAAEVPSRRNADRQRKALWVGLAISAAFHALVLFGWRVDMPSGPGSLAAGPRAGDILAAPGGGGMIGVNIAAPRPIEVPAPPTTRPDLAVPDIEIREVDRQVITASLTGPSGGGLPSSVSGAGLPGGQGAGAGGGDLQGRDRRTFPTPRSIIPRWNPPDGLKGRRVTFRVHVDARGQPTGEIQIQPNITDTAFERQLRKDILAMDFLPGRRDGRPVAEWAELTFTF